MITTESPETKTCSKCGKVYPLSKENFQTKVRKDGSIAYFAQCRQCIRERRQRWREANREKLAQAKREYDKRTRYQQRLRKRQYYKNNKEKINAERRAAYISRVRRQEELWYQNNTEPPKCQCGCGQPVNFGEKGPRKFLFNHQNNVPELTERKRRLLAEERERNRVPLNKIRALLFDYKERHNLTLNQLAERCGLSVGHLNALLYSNDARVKGVTKEWAAGLLDRLAGKGSNPTAYQKRRAAFKESETVVMEGGLYGLMVVRNEADRYLQSCLEWHMDIFDDLFIVDDQSDDETVELCLSYTSSVITRPDEIPSFMEHEGKFRQFAWSSMVSMLELTEKDWIVVVDADEFLVSSSAASTRDVLDQMRFKLTGEGSWASRVKKIEIFDSDDDGLYGRVDGFWKRDAKAMIARYRERDGGFSNREMACGRLPAWYENQYINHPANLRPAGDDLTLLHVGYMDKNDRIEKHKRYTSKGNHGHSRSHIESILKTPRLEKWQGQTPPVWRGMM